MRGGERSVRRILFIAAILMGCGQAFAQNQPPTISLWSPSNGATLQAPGLMQLRVVASDPDGSVTKVEYFRNGIFLGAVTTPPFSANWTNVPAGTYTMTAKAFDNAGATTVSTGRTVTVHPANAANPAPAVSLLNPNAGATYNSPATVQMFSSATDDVSVNRVEYYITMSGSDVLQCIALGPPWYCPLGGIPAATWPFKARAFDNLGKSTLTPANSIVVTTPNASNPAPTITLTRPVNGATYVSPAVLPLRATAADSNGTVNRVEYYVNGYWLATSTTAPYGFDWSGVAAGTYNLSATVWDNQGKSTTSATAVVTVHDPSPGNPPPSVAIVRPVMGATYEAAANVTVGAAATDNVSINRVEIYASGVYQATLMSAPYETTFTGVPAGSYDWTAIAYDNQGASTTSPVVATQVLAPNPGNLPPTISLTLPTNNASYSAPATIPLSATAADSDGSINRVEFFANGVQLGTVTTPPYTGNWAAVPPGTYSITATAWDNLGRATTSAPATVTVSPAQQLYFIHPDHLNTPRLITNAAQQVVWRWDNDDPFGNNPPNENPSGLGQFTCNLRMPGQYYDKETNLHYNYFRDYDPAIGRYIQSDPIGLAGGINTYAYVGGNPLSRIDPTGEADVDVRIQIAMARAGMPVPQPPSGELDVSCFMNCIVFGKAATSAIITVAVEGGANRLPTSNFAQSARQASRNPVMIGVFALYGIDFCRLNCRRDPDQCLPPPPSVPFFLGAP